jgi:hypothetical protein
MWFDLNVGLPFPVHRSPCAIKLMPLSVPIWKRLTINGEPQTTFFQEQR